MIGYSKVKKTSKISQYTDNIKINMGTLLIRCL